MRCLLSFRESSHVIIVSMSVSLYDLWTPCLWMPFSFENASNSASRDLYCPIRDCKTCWIWREKTQDAPERKRDVSIASGAGGKPVRGQLDVPLRCWSRARGQPP